jgi:hypothetical protein
MAHGLKSGARMIRSPVAVLALSALAAGCEKPAAPLPGASPIARPATTLRLAIAPTPVREGPERRAAVLRLAPRGEKLSVWRDDRDPEHVLRVSSGGFVDGRDVFTIPLQVETRYVIDPEATLFSDHQRRQPTAKLKLGEALTVIQAEAWPLVATVESATCEIARRDSAHAIPGARSIEALERAAGLMRLNFNDTGALEIFLLSVLRIWSRKD